MTGIQDIFDEQQKNLQQLKNTSCTERIKKIDRIYSFLNNPENQKKLFQALSHDLGKSEMEAKVTELFPVISNLKHIKAHLRSWMRDERRSTPLPLLGAKSYVKYEPKGSSLIIAPWNYPFSLAIDPFLYAIASGCSAIIKPSEYSEHTSQYIQDMISELFPQGEYAVVQGAVPESQFLLSLPFHHIFFTGSPQVGKIVMESAAKHLTSVTLELGGKSPCIIDETVDLKKIAPKIIWGKLVNSGQTCIAPDYLLVQEKVKPKLIKELQSSMNSLFGSKDGLEQNKDYGRIINSKNYDRLMGYLSDARGKSEEIIALGKNNAESKFFAPHLIIGPATDSDIMQEEIFGPLLPILTFKSIEDTTVIIESLPKPLSLYIMSNNKKNIDYLLKHTTAGGTVINDFLIHFSNSNLPFGGVNNSGIGKSNGAYSFRSFSNERAVMHQKWGFTSLLYPPYTDNKNKLVNFMLKWLS